METTASPPSADGKTTCPSGVTSFLYTPAGSGVMILPKISAVGAVSDI